MQMHMDQIFLPYTATATPNGVPQESKLATYMNNRPPPNAAANNSAHATAALAQSFAKVSLIDKKQSPEFVPGQRTLASSNSSSPNLFNSYNLNPQVATGFGRHIDSPQQSGETISPIMNSTPQDSPPPPAGVLGTSSPIIEKPSLPIAYQENVGGTTYFYSTPTAADASHASTNDTLGSLNSSSGVGVGYQVYPGTPSHVGALKHRNNTTTNVNASFFVSDDLRLEMLNRNALTLMQADPETAAELPAEVDNYHELCPLEPIIPHKPYVGYQVSMYKATNVKSGMRYCLRRIHNYRLQNTKCMQYVEMWKKLSHSNIVQLKEVFTTKAFGDNSMVFVYDYHPGSETLLTKHFSPEQLNGYADPFADTASPRPYSQQKTNLLRHAQSHKLPEPLIWNYIIQLTSALRVIHSAGLACRSLDPTKIIITSGHRLRLSCLGVMDVIMTDSSMEHFQQEDLTALGKLVLALACKSTSAVQHANISTAIDVVTRTYTQDLRNLIMYLLTNRRRTLVDLMPMIGARFYTQLDNVQGRVDVLENEVSKEMENGRLFRLLVKLGMINERPEFNLDGTWAETGDRYMLKLFRDYVFHQVTVDGRPWVDMAHVVQCLNKLDAGVAEKVPLMSRDEQSILVVSYAELKHCLEQSFDEIMAVAMLPPENVT